MVKISTRAHGMLDYAGGALLLSGRGPLRSADSRGNLLLRVAGASMVVGSAVTDQELGLRRLVPMPLHLVGDGLLGAVLVIAPLKLRRGGRIIDWIPHAALGASAIAGALLTERSPSDRGAQDPGTERPQPAAAPPGGQGQAAQSSPQPASSESATPGVSATSPESATLVESAGQGSETGASTTSADTSAEHPDRQAVPGSSPDGGAGPSAALGAAFLPDSLGLGLDEPAVLHGDDELVAREEAAAAAEAAGIGGAVTPDSADPALDPVYQAGGGEQDGFEAAERALIENATHGEGHGDPLRDAFTGEAQSDRSGAVYGEADHVRSSEGSEGSEGYRSDRS